MKAKYKYRHISDESEKYFLLSNGKYLNVYYHNGEEVNEFKLKDISHGVIVDEKIYAFRLYTQFIYCINIQSGEVNKIYFKKEIKKISRIYKDEYANKVFIVGSTTIKLENQKLATQFKLMSLDTLTEKYHTYELDLHFSVSDIVTYKKQKYFLLYESSSGEIHLCRSTKNKLEKVGTCELIKKAYKYKFSKNGKYLMVLYRRRWMRPAQLKVFKTEDNVEVWSYTYNDKDSMFIGNIFSFENKDYIYVYDDFEIPKIDYKQPVSKYTDESTFIFDLETGEKVKELKKLFRIIPIDEESILCEVNKFGSNVRNVFLHNSQDFLENL